MNKYFEKIKEVAENFRNTIKARNLKKKILENSSESKNGMELDENLITKDVISLVLQDMSVINKLNEEGTLLYYVSLLKEDEQLTFFNKYSNIFKEEDLDKVYSMALKNISIEELLKTELGDSVIGAFPRECYQKVSELSEDTLLEINSKRTTNISLLSIADAIFNDERGEENWQKREDFLKENINAEDKISVLKEKKVPVYLLEIINSTMDDVDKIKLISDMDIEITPNDLISFDMSDEIRNCALKKVSEDEYKSFLEDTFSTNQKSISYYKTQQIMKTVSVFGEENVTSYLTEEQKQNYKLVTELRSNFNDDEQKLLLTTGTTKNTFLEMNFLNKYQELYSEEFSSNALREIIDRENGLAGLKNYCNFRKDSNDLDFGESLFQSLYEYKKYGNLYNEILSHFNELSDEEKSNFKTDWNDLMQLKNKFEIKNIQEFKSKDQIEKNYYSQILNKSTSKEAIRNVISEILVRNGNVYDITKLGNGVDYSMQNKSLEDIIDLLSTINEISDVDALKGILKDCIEMIGTEELKGIRKIGSNIEEKIVHEYRKGYVDSFTNYDEMTDDELKEIEGIKVQRIKGIRVIELTGADFSFLSHSGGIKGNHVRCCCSQITDENFSTFGDGLRGYTYIYSRFSPNRIKFINLGDAGCSDYKNTYISAEDLSPGTQSSCIGTFNEVTLVTRKEDGDDGLKPSAIMTRNMVNSTEFNSIIEGFSNSDSKPQTIYVLHEDIYNKKKEQDLSEKDELVKKYQKTLDPKLLNLILRSTGGNKQQMQLMMEDIKKNIRVHIDSHVGKGTLRRNVTRYWQLSRGKNSILQLPYDIMTELQKELNEADNELLVGQNIGDKVKEVSDEYYEYGE